MIGYIGRISQGAKRNESRRRVDGQLRGSDYIGKGWHRALYEKGANGTAGATEVEVDASRAVIRTLSRKPSVTGNNLQPSLDIRLQKIAEDAFGSKRGALGPSNPPPVTVLALRQQTRLRSEPVCRWH